MQISSQKFYGKYKGLVMTAKDPEMLGRIKAFVPSVYGKDEKGNLVSSPWALPCVAFAGSGEGALLLPKPNAGVWVEFEEGDINKPIWSGCFWTRPSKAGTFAKKGGIETPSRDDYPENRVIETEFHRIELNDVTREVRIMSTVQDADIAIKWDGSISLENGQHQLFMGGKNQGSLFRYTHKLNEATIQVLEVGDIFLNTGGTALTIFKETGDMSLEHKSGTSIDIYQDAIEMDTMDGSSFSLSKVHAKLELASGQSIMIDQESDRMELTAGEMVLDCDSVELSSAIIQQPLLTTGFLVPYNQFVASYNGLITRYNILVGFFKALVGSVAPPMLPAIEAALPTEPLALPVPPIPGDNCTAQVTGG